MSDLLEPSLLRKLLKYEPATGDLYWKERTPDVFTDGRVGRKAKCARWNTQWAGKRAFAASRLGYLYGYVLGKQVLGHRVIWAMVNDEWPVYIDHIDGDPTNNRIDNLRSVTPAENAKNRRVSKNNKSGYPGVCWIEGRGAWEVAIFSQRKRHYLGRFKSKREAIQVRKKAEVESGFHRNHGRKALAKAEAS